MMVRFGESDPKLFGEDSHRTLHQEMFGFVFTATNPRQRIGETDKSLVELWGLDTIGEFKFSKAHPNGTYL